jgi:hypothetical protein
MAYVIKVFEKLTGKINIMAIYASASDIYEINCF